MGWITSSISEEVFRQIQKIVAKLTLKNYSY